MIYLSCLEMKNFLINVLFPSYALTILTSPKDNISKLEIFHKSVSCISIICTQISNKHDEKCHKKYQETKRLKDTENIPRIPFLIHEDERVRNE